MSTRSNIGIQNEDGTVDFIYCHSDGYPSHHWPILTEHYATEEKVRALLALGDLSRLGEEIGQQHHPFTSHWPRHAAFCLAYGRDRGEAGTEAKLVQSFDEFDAQANQDYAYLFRVGRWQWRRFKSAVQERALSWSQTYPSEED